MDANRCCFNGWNFFDNVSELHPETFIDRFCEASGVDHVEHNQDL
jgi:hypothetical protein